MQARSSFQGARALARSTVGRSVIPVKCPYCTCQDTRVIDSRDSRDLEVVRRRRQCVACEKRFTTYERFERAELRVVKRNGRVEDFDRDKVEVGVLKACEKRPISREAIARVIDEVEETCRAAEDGTVEAAVIGGIVLDKLQELDEVAYMRFASVYKQFGDASQFERELKQLRQSRLRLVEPAASPEKND